jgi:alkaline phosphatase
VLRRATLAAALTATAALAIVRAWTGAAGEKKRARNVIVLQGDGMGTAQRDLIRLVTAGNTPGAELQTRGR